MSYCDDRVAFLDRRLPLERMAAFERHCRECDDCRREIERWDAIVVALRESVQNQIEAGELPAATQLLARARADREATATVGWRWLMVPVAAALAAVVVVTAYRARMSTLRDEAPSAIESTNESVATSLGRDTISATPHTKIVVLEARRDRTRLRLERGSATFDVDTSRGPRDFRVQATDMISVRVTGTRFTVSHVVGGVDVAVEHGSVVVENGDEVLALRAGDRASVLEKSIAPNVIAAPSMERGDQPAKPEAPPAPPLQDSASQPKMSQAPLPTPSKAPPAPAKVLERAPAPIVVAPQKRKRAPGSKVEARYDVWTAAAGSGNCPEVVDEMQDRVDFAPDDARTWSLLADCQRKLHHWTEAAEAYEKVVDIGPQALATRARYLAGEIELDQLGNPRRAIGLLESYLAAENHVEALDRGARLRLGRAFMQIGERPRARAMLTDLVRNHGDTPEGREAQGLLGEL